MYLCALIQESFHVCFCLYFATAQTGPDVWHLPVAPVPVPQPVSALVCARSADAGFINNCMKGVQKEK